MFSVILYYVIHTYSSTFYFETEKTKQLIAFDRDSYIGIAVPGVVPIRASSGGCIGIDEWPNAYRYRL